MGYIHIYFLSNIADIVNIYILAKGFFVCLYSGYDQSAVTALNYSAFRNFSENLLRNAFSHGFEPSDNTLPQYLCWVGESITDVSD